MSLKTFHIFFVTVSILFLLGFSGWALKEYWRVDHATNLLLQAGGALIFAVLLVAYGWWFLHKLKDVK